jgi:uncharacterized DUF497 family protein
MKIIFDPVKDAVNIDKHGISLAMAEEFEWEEAVTWPDIRYDYREFRIIGLGYIGDRLYNMVFVDRGEERRIVSLRKANQREVKRYAQT